MIDIDSLQTPYVGIASSRDILAMVSLSASLPFARRCGKDGLELAERAIKGQCDMSATDGSVEGILSSLIIWCASHAKDRRKLRMATCGWLPVIDRGMSLEDATLCISLGIDENWQSLAVVLARCLVLAEALCIDIEPYIMAKDLQSWKKSLLQSAS